jgi:hypothetical protein
MKNISCISPVFYCCVRVLLSDGCFYGSTILAWSKYATILKWILQRLYVEIWTRFIWLRIRISGGLL